MAGKLTFAQAQEIRALMAAGSHTEREIAERYGCCQQNVNHIVHFKVFKCEQGRRGFRWWHSQKDGVCSACGERRPVEEFGDVVVRGKYYKRRVCKACECARLKASHPKELKSAVCKECGRRTKSGLRTEICRPCEIRKNREALAAERAENRKRRSETRKHWKKTLRDGWKQMAMQSRGNKCSRCGLESNIPAAFDFHHPDPAVKAKSLAQCRTWKDFYAEIERCDMVCATCHRIIHWLARHPEDAMSQI